LGMSDTLGPIVFGSGHDEVFLGKDFSSARNFSEKIASQIDDEIHSIISEGYSTAEKIITEHTEEMHFIAEYLVANEVMDSDQFLAVFEEDRSFEKLDAIRDNKVKRSEEANRKTKTEETNDSDDDVDGETEEIIKH